QTDPKKSEKQTARVKELTDRKESFERQLAGQLPEFAKQLQAGRRKHADLIALLPAGMVVVDLLRYTYHEQDPKVPGKKGERETPSYVAFVLRRGQPVVRIELGPAAPIDAAVAAWRGQLAPSGDAGIHPKPIAGALPPVHDKNPDAQLRQLVWQPLEKVFPADTTTVALCPDEQLTAIPWSALPGRKAGTAVLEDYALAAIPNGQFLLEMLAAKPRPAGSHEKLLAVGGVNYDDPAQPAKAKPEQLAASGDRAPRRDAAVDEKQELKLTWPYLKGAQGEVERIRTLAKVQTTVPLAGAEASEDRVLAELPTVRFAHFATHGFFSPPHIRSALAADPKAADRAGLMAFDAVRRVAVGRSPLVLSGLVLAGANRPRKKNEWGVTIGNDGILTAEEIVGLDLSNLDLAVLSACDTGLGSVAGGEGVFGLQRAFHLAGAKKVVASLWKVDDQATAALMGLFYEKLWKQNKPPIEALREAQLAIYRNPDLIGKLAGQRGQSFSKTVDLVDAGRRAPDGKTSHPRFWAAWVLSGPGR
ncbi:MAG: CHAT domain-containing protein, partial [Pirellulales bacterium]